MPAEQLIVDLAIRYGLEDDGSEGVAWGAGVFLESGEGWSWIAKVLVAERDWWS